MPPYLTTYLARRVCWTCGILTARRDLGARLHHTDHLHETTAQLDQPWKRVARDAQDGAQRPEAGTEGGGGMSGVGMTIERMTCKQRTAALAYLTGYCYSILQRLALQSDNPAGAMEVHLAALAIASPEAADLVRKVGS